MSYYSLFISVSKQTTDMDEELKFYEELNTRAASYKKPVIEIESPAPYNKRSKRNIVFLKCREQPCINEK